MATLSRQMELGDNDYGASPREETGSANQTVVAVADGNAFFQRIDWLSFGVTTVFALALYLFTLAPEVTLEMSGTPVFGDPGI